MKTHAWKDVLIDGAMSDKWVSAHDAKLLYEALEECEKDLVAYQFNARLAAQRDPRWEGVAEAVQPSIDRSRSAKSKARGEN